METTVWKEKCIGNKLNIYTSIQCVVSRGLTLGKLETLQSSDCTQWGIHSLFFFFSIKIITEQQTMSGWQLHCPHRPGSSSGERWDGRRAASQSLFLQQLFSNSFYFQEDTSWSCKTEKAALRFSTNSNGFQVFEGAEKDCYISTAEWDHYGRRADRKARWRPFLSRKENRGVSDTGLDNDGLDLICRPAVVVKLTEEASKSSKGRTLKEQYCISSPLLSFSS